MSLSSADYDIKAEKKRLCRSSYKLKPIMQDIKRKKEKKTKPKPYNSRPSKAIKLKSLDKMHTKFR